MKSYDIITNHNKMQTNRAVMKQENTTVDDLQKARLYMNECPKGSLPNNFMFPDC